MINIERKKGEREFRLFEIKSYSKSKTIDEYKYARKKNLTETDYVVTTHFSFFFSVFIVKSLSLFLFLATQKHGDLKSRMIKR